MFNIKKQVQKVWAKWNIAAYDLIILRLTAYLAEKLDNDTLSLTHEVMSAPIVRAAYCKMCYEMFPALPFSARYKNNKELGLRWLQLVQRWVDAKADDKVRESLAQLKTARNKDMNLFWETTKDCPN